MKGKLGEAGLKLRGSWGNGDEVEGGSGVEVEGVLGRKAGQVLEWGRSLEDMGQKLKVEAGQKLGEWGRIRMEGKGSGEEGEAGK